jgi:hypothetical protein
MKTVSVRLRELRGGAVNLFVRGMKFVAGEWTEVPETLALESGGEFPLLAYVTSLRDMEDRPLFEVAAEAPAAAVEQAAVPESDGGATDEASAQDAGAEAIPPDQREAELAERAAIDAAQGAEAGKPDAEGADGAAPAPDAQPTGRRAQRLARRKTAKEPATG